MKIDKRLFIIFFISISANISLSAIRVVTYNMYSGSSNYDPGSLDNKIAVLRAIDNYPYNNIDRPFDILVAQELMSNHVIESYLVNGSGSVNGLNDYYGSGTYAYDAGTVGGDGYNYNGMIYNTTTVQLIQRRNFRAPGAPRDTVRYRFRILGYGPESDIYIYNSHLKAYSDAASRITRTKEAQYIRWSIAYGGDSLPEGTNIIYAGDFNLTGGGTEDCVMTNGDVSSLGGYDNPWYYYVKQVLFAGTGAAYTSTGYGLAFDPAGITSPVNWNNSSSYRRLHTWNSTTPTSRLDFQLVSSELYDGEGVSLIAPGVGNCTAIENSYRPLGNDGTHTYGGLIKYSASSRYTIDVFNNLQFSSDHLPVIADYQRPAVLEVSVQMPSEPVDLNSPTVATVTVSNAAQVSSPVGADELDYEIVITNGGTLTDSGIGSDYALGSGNTHEIRLNTLTTGIQSLQIRVSSSSQACANPVYEQTFPFEVVEPISEISSLFYEQFIPAWLSECGDASYNVDCDFDSNCIIDFSDFELFSENWLIDL